MKKSADITLVVAVVFEDDGVNALADQAHDALMLASASDLIRDCEVEKIMVSDI